MKGEGKNLQIHYLQNETSTKNICIYKTIYCMTRLESFLRLSLSVNFLQQVFNSLSIFDDSGQERGRCGALIGQFYAHRQWK